MTSDVKKYVKLVLLHVKDDGSVEVIPFTMGQNNVVTFKADEFSYYAFAGVEKQPVTDSEVTDTNNNAPTSPKTGDNRTKKKDTRMIFALIMVVVALMLLGIAKDCGVLDSHYIDNTIGIVALLFALVSIPRIKESIGKKLTGPSLLKKLWCLVMIVCIPFYIVLIMNLVGLSSSVSNFCGLIGIIISIFTW